MCVMARERCFRVSDSIRFDSILEKRLATAYVQTTRMNGAIGLMVSRYHESGLGYEATEFCSSKAELCLLRQRARRGSVFNISAFAGAF